MATIYSVYPLVMVFNFPNYGNPHYDRGEIRELQYRYQWARLYSPIRIMPYRIKVFS